VLKVQDGASQAYRSLVITGPVTPQGYRWPIHWLAGNGRFQALALGHLGHDVPPVIVLSGMVLYLKLLEMADH